MNRRPGDWDCPSCNAHNFASKQACYHCGEAKPANLPTESVYGGGYNGGFQGAANRRPGDWDCDQCGAHNFASRNACYKCQAPKSNVTVPETAPPAVDETNKNEDTDMGVFGDQGMVDVPAPTGLPFGNNGSNHENQQGVATAPGMMYDMTSGGVAGGLNQPMATNLQFFPQQNMLGGLGGAQWDQPYN